MGRGAVAEGFGVHTTCDLSQKLAGDQNLWGYPRSPHIFNGIALIKMNLWDKLVKKIDVILQWSLLVLCCIIRWINIYCNLMCKFCDAEDLSMEKWFPIGNQMIDPRICYVNEPYFTHAHFLLNPSANRASWRRRWLVKSSQKIGFEIRKWACVKPGSFIYRIRGSIICLPS